MKNIAILGSTGSIGTSALDVVSRFPGQFRVSALSVNSNIKALAQQVRRFKPGAVGIADLERAREFERMSGSKYLKVYKGVQGLCEMVRRVRADTLVVGIVGSHALLPVLAALGKVKRVALANKEALVMAGNIIMKNAKLNGTEILPVDSEHSAIFQCLGSMDRPAAGVRRIYLTSSGGPLLKTPRSGFRDITVKKATSHPKWKMGRKISVDSATMMNKGLEVIEAHWLFGVDSRDIKILVHPETIVHSMVEFADGSILGQMGNCDMRLPIQYALTYPGRLPSRIKEIDFTEIGGLTFQRPDFKKFPCLGLAYEAIGKGGTYPCVLNASNEVAVNEFLSGAIKFDRIPVLIEKALRAHRGVKSPGLDDILEADIWARFKTKEMVG